METFIISLLVPGSSLFQSHALLCCCFNQVHRTMDNRKSRIKLRRYGKSIYNNRKIGISISKWLLSFLSFICWKFSSWFYEDNLEGSFSLQFKIILIFSSIFCSHDLRDCRLGGLLCDFWYSKYLTISAYI